MSKNDNDFIEQLLKQKDSGEYRSIFEHPPDIPFPDVPSWQDIAGPIVLGMLLLTGDQAGIFLKELNQHLLILGRAGAGKTNLIFILFYQLFLQISCWFFDFKKDYRQLLQYTNNIFVFRWQKLKINPLRPPEGTDPVKWIQVFSDIFCVSFGLMGASKNVLVETIYELYELYGVFKGSDTYPSVLDLNEMFARKVKRKGIPNDLMGYLIRILNKIGPFCMIMRDVLDCDRGYSLEDLIKSHLIFEFDGLTEEFQTFLVNYFLAFVFTYRIERGQRGSLDLAIIFDEASRVFKKNIKTDLGTPYIEQIVRLIREFGVGLVVADQMPHALADSIKSNVFTTTALSLSNGKDIDDVVRAMRLSKDQADYLGRQDVGQAVVKLAGRYPEPFPIVIPHFPIQRYISDDEVDNHMRSTYGI